MESELDNLRVMESHMYMHSKPQTQQMICVDQQVLIVFDLPIEEQM